ncbi:carboxyl transferase domain-containing protein [Corynebacterium choanae]|uniref:Acetyl-coenzyme A carboxylase carboxyl transferase subunits beta/alpha n=1 Tax=Corynebacterium choanae TaxID=1862358 RepID=A0A3G6J808_9CORY|nr:carboxyl transferase domain-containing protein [Corynebacterium choanae]AZA13038.1 Acetyl-coenzyme A carboxylase carboxyl transferase subunit beta [Corynebacterium choanae]
MSHLHARELIARTLDTDSFISWDTPPDYGEISADYAAILARAREKSGCDEAVLTGCGTIDGRRVACIVSEFSFLGGSIGKATAHRIIAAIHRATADKLPLLIAPASGGTRMQEGTLGFTLMVSITTAVYKHKDEHLPFLVYLRNPTTGGVMASWGSAGHFTFAEPDALLGFLGPRVVELVTGESIEQGVQSGENLARVGVIDGVVSPEMLRAAMEKIIDVLLPADDGFGDSREDTIGCAAIDTDLIGRHTAVEQVAVKGHPGATALPRTAHTIEQAATTSDRPALVNKCSDTTWESILQTRRDDRPGLQEIIAALADQSIALSGSGDGRRSTAVNVLLTRIGGRPVVLIGQNRATQPPVGDDWLGPAALRMARRGIKLAHELNLPLVSIIDTPGGEMSAQAEEQGMAGSIARTLGEMVYLDVPTVSVILGQGCGGAALAMMPADKVLVCEHSWLSPLPPEGASAILYRDTDHAAEMMERQQVGAAALQQAGIADAIIAEYPSASDEPDAFIARVLDVIHDTLVELHAHPETAGRARRFARYEQLAGFHTDTPEDTV